MYKHLRLLKQALLPYDFPSSQQYVTEHNKKEDLWTRK